MTKKPTPSRRHERSMLDCSACEGTGLEGGECSVCDSNGWVDDPEDGGTMTCPECNDERCAYCGGEGRVNA